MLARLVACACLDFTVKHCLQELSLLRCQTPIGLDSMSHSGDAAGCWAGHLSVLSLTWFIGQIPGQ